MPTQSATGGSWMVRTLDLASAVLACVVSAFPTTLLQQLFEHRWRGIPLSPPIGPSQQCCVRTTKIS